MQGKSNNFELQAVLNVVWAQCAEKKLLLTLTGGRVLQIPRAQAEDSGRYICIAVNEAGEDSIHYDVRVLCK